MPVDYTNLYVFSVIGTPVVGEGIGKPVPIHTHIHVLLTHIFPSPLLFIPDSPIFIG
jgi:hypothetical protein